MTTVSNGQLAVNQLLADAGRYDAVLMDVQMPVLNGYDATEAIRAAGLTLPVVAMTANVMEEDRQRAAEAGMDAHVAKPVDVEILIAILRDLAPGVVPEAAPGARDSLPAAALSAPAYALPAHLPGIDLDTALARMGGNYDALAALLKRFERTHGDTVLDVRAAIGSGERLTAVQSLHRLRGVAANLGANEVARLSAVVETALHQHHTEAALHAALDHLALALDTVAGGARVLDIQEEMIPSSNIDQAELALTLAELQSLLQNNNLKALEHFRMLRPSLAAMQHAVQLAEAVESLDFERAARLVDEVIQEMKQRKDSA